MDMEIRNCYNVGGCDEIWEPWETSACVRMRSYATSAGYYTQKPSPNTNYFLSYGTITFI